MPHLPMSLLCWVFLVFISINSAYAKVPFWGDPKSQSVDIEAANLKPGQWVWAPQAASVGPIVVLVSLKTQLAYVYRNGLLIGYSAVSTGKKGHETPTGVFTTLQKDKDHRSSIYNSAPMPFTQRLTWGGVALHAGGLPGYPSSHGCVHLPSAFAAQLFDASPLGMTVVVTEDGTDQPDEVKQPSLLAPIDADSGQVRLIPRLERSQAFRWEPEKSASGPVSILISSSNQRAFVYRNGVEIGRARIQIDDKTRPLGTHVFMITKNASSADQEPQWIAVGIPGHDGEDKQPLDPNQAARVQVPSQFRQAVRELLVAGTTLMVTDAKVLPQTSNVEMTVVTNQPIDHELNPES